MLYDCHDESECPLRLARVTWSSSDRSQNSPCEDQRCTLGICFLPFLHMHHTSAALGCCAGNVPDRRSGLQHTLVDQVEFDVQLDVPYVLCWHSAVCRPVN